MSSPHHAAAVILESIRVYTVDMTGARNITRDTTLANVSHHGNAVEYTVQGARINMSGWTNAFMGLERTPFDDDTTTRAVADFTGAVTVYTDLMIALIEKHDVLTSENSPSAPDGADIGLEITFLYITMTALVGWLRAFAPTRVDEINAQGQLARDAFDLAAKHYPRPTARGPEQSNVVQVGREVKVCHP